MRKLLLITFLIIFLLTGCATETPPPPTHTPTSPPPTVTSTQTATYTSTFTATFTLTPSITSTSTETPTATLTPTETETPTPSDTPTPSVTPTEEPATITADGNVNCRYGPDPVYMYAWLLSDGDTAMLDGRNYAGTWLWVLPHDTDWHCWVSSSFVTASVDIMTVPVVYPPIYINPSVPSLTGVKASRSGSSVTVSWNPAPPSVGLGYLIEARICNGTYLLDVVYSTTNTSFTLSDKSGCSGDSYGQARVFNKLGYGAPTKISWP